MFVPPFLHFPVTRLGLQGLYFLNRKSSRCSGFLVQLLCWTGLFCWLLSGLQFSTPIKLGSPFNGGLTTDTKNGFKHQYFIITWYTLLYPSHMHNTCVPFHPFVIGQYTPTCHASFSFNAVYLSYTATIYQGQDCLQHHLYSFKIYFPTLMRVTALH